MQLLLLSLADEVYVSWIYQYTKHINDILLVIPEERRDRVLAEVSDPWLIEHGGLLVIYFFLPEKRYESLLQYFGFKGILKSLLEVEEGLAYFQSKEVLVRSVLKALGILNLESALKKIWEEEDDDECMVYLCVILRTILQEKQYSSFFIALGNTKIHDMISSSNDLALFLDCVPHEQREALLWAIGSENIQLLINNGVDLGQILNLLPMERYQAILTKIGHEKLIEIMLTKDALHDLLNSLSKKQCTAFILTLPNKILWEITRWPFRNVGILLSYLPTNQYKTFLTRLRNEEIDHMVSFSSGVQNTFAILSTSQILAFLLLIEDQYVKRLVQSYDTLRVTHGGNIPQLGKALLALPKVRGGKSWIDEDDSASDLKTVHKGDVTLAEVLITETMLAIPEVRVLLAPDEQEKLPMFTDSKAILKFINAGGDIEIAKSVIQEFRESKITCLATLSANITASQKILTALESLLLMLQQQQDDRYAEEVESIITVPVINDVAAIPAQAGIHIDSDPKLEPGMDFFLHMDDKVGETICDRAQYSKMGCQNIDPILESIDNSASVIVSPDATEPRPSESGNPLANARDPESTGEIMTKADNSSSKALQVAGRRDLYCQQPLKIQESISQFILSAENALNFLDAYAAGDSVSVALAIVRRDLLKLRDKLQADATIERPFILSNNEKNSVQIISNNIRLLKTNHFEGRDDQNKYISIFRHILNGFTYVFTLGQVTNRNLIAEKTIGRSFFFQHSKTEDETAAINKNIGSLLKVTESLSQLLEFEEDTCKNGNL